MDSWVKMWLDALWGCEICCMSTVSQETCDIMCEHFNHLLRCWIWEEGFPHSPVGSGSLAVPLIHAWAEPSRVGPSPACGWGRRAGSNRSVSGGILFGALLKTLNQEVQGLGSRKDPTALNTTQKRSFLPSDVFLPFQIYPRHAW